MKRLFITITLIFSVSAAGLYAQQARIPGLEKNEGYMELLGRQRELKRVEDSTSRLIIETRERFEADREAGISGSGLDFGQEIVRLEGELFEVRSRIGRITAQVSEIEQDFILNNIAGPAEEIAVGGGVRTLFQNRFFVDNLEQNEITLLSLTPKVEPEVVKIDGVIKDLYVQLEQVRRQYDAADDQESIDSLAARAGVLKEQIEQQDAMMERLWQVVYNRKMDLYPVLIDKIGKVSRAKREMLDQESRTVRRAEGLAGEQLAPLVSTFPLQKRLVLNYEIILAETLGLTAAMDSLLAEYQKIPALDAMIYHDIEFRPRSLVIYSQITKIEPGTETDTEMDGEYYEDITAIPQLYVPRQGIYYAIQLSIYTTPPAVTVFRRMSPMRRQKLADGRTRYVAGGFRTHTEAQQALVQMQRAGFRAPIVVAWIDGRLSTVTKAKIREGSLAETTGGGGVRYKYSVDIIPSQARLSAGLREIITSQIGDMTGISIVRGANAAKEIVYSVGNFAHKSDADRLATALTAGDPSVRIEIVEL